MAYTKTNWVNGQQPAISATNLNKIEQGIYENDAAIATKANASDVYNKTTIESKLDDKQTKFAKVSIDGDEYIISPVGNDTISFKGDIGYIPGENVSSYSLVNRYILEHEFLRPFLRGQQNFNGSKTQILKNVNGVIMWVDED